jgi:hypothetical protein
VRGAPDLSQPDALRVAEAARERLGEAGFAEAFRAAQDWTALAEAVLTP